MWQFFLLTPFRPLAAGALFIDQYEMRCSVDREEPTRLGGFGTEHSDGVLVVDTHTVIVQVDSIAYGSVSGGGRYTYGTVATLTAAPYSGYQFSHWSNGATFNPYVFAVVSDTVLTAHFIADWEPYQDTIHVYDTIYLPVHDTTYIIQTDTVVNTVHDTLWLTLHDTIYLPQYIYDTIYIHDTVYVGIDGVETINVKIYTSGGQIVVDGSEGNQVWLYDINGRLMATKRDDHSPLRFEIPSSGTYLVRIGDYHSRKVVVIK